MRRLGFFVLPGKSDEVEIFEILGRRETVDEADQRLCERFAAGWSCSRAGIGPAPPSPFSSCPWTILRMVRPGITGTSATATRRPAVAASRSPSHPDRRQIRTLHSHRLGSLAIR